ncbi:complex I NDUFA9 subunit family protein [Saliniramus sp.]|uniref:complex I NDUFA9 subunit family protein n=1 Tax=Saliniramus sp. TaxID=2986772 RepID=UPI002BD8D01B|nr:complex I NDUFA9 subunit family protein [Saliniramus sp.]HMB09113.1 complex I NDUFA9 subunit family protein [Saliniramus sp.]
MSASNQQPHPVTGKLVTVFGGSGFLGRFVVQTLARRGYRVRVAVRRPDLAQNLQPLGAVGQIHAVQANLRYPESVRAAAQGADAVVNLVGILQQGGRQTFEALQTVGAETVARAASENGARMVQVSAIGADADSPAQYGRTKAEGEARVLAVAPQAVILRPSIVFGPGDSFFNRFAALARVFPVLPIACADSRFQPVYAGDVAEAVARAVDNKVEGGKIYELGGPGIYSFRELLAYVLEVTERKRIIAAMPPALARLQASITETLDRFTFGLMPDEIVLTRDQLLMLEDDNVVSPQAEAQGRTFAALGITPTSLEAIVPGYLKRFRKHGQYEKRKTAA